MSFRISTWQPGREGNRFGWLENVSVPTLCKAMFVIELLESMGWDRRATIAVEFVSGEPNPKRTKKPAAQTKHQGTLFKDQP